MKLEVLKGAGIVKDKVDLLKTRDKGVVRVLLKGHFPKKMKITKIEWEHKEGRSAGGSAVGAIGGGLLAGPLGLIAGAAIGGRKKDVSTAVVSFEDVGDVLVRISAKDYQVLESWV